MKPCAVQTISLTFMIERTQQVCFPSPPSFPNSILLGLGFSLVCGSLEIDLWQVYVSDSFSSRTAQNSLVNVCGPSDCDFQISKLFFIFLLLDYNFHTGKAFDFPRLFFFNRSQSPFCTLLVQRPYSPG